jgi:Family of unknown function (DUF6390)
MNERGLLFHAKHAFMPNNLGYCGPDDRGRILLALVRSKGGEKLVSTLKEFEAAYPFLNLIARSTGRDAFDYSVPEAYWIGNGLLDRVPVPEFYTFSHRELNGKDPKEVRKVFRSAGAAARPHHSFYVMSTFASSSVADGPSVENANAKKVSALIDSCRVSWGTVREVGAGELRVEYRPVAIEHGRLKMSAPKMKKVSYNPEVTPFGAVRPGDVVSLHWDYACEVLSARQVRNISKYTLMDLVSVNKMLAKRRS